MTREQMIDKIVRMYGFENETTILFCRLAEKLPKMALVHIYIILVARR